MNQPMHSIESEVAAAMPFSGNPRLYKRIAIVGSCAMHIYLFVGYWAIKTWVADEAWPTSWVQPALAVASAALFARFAYAWIMRLDAQYGRGSGWLLETTSVKLPWLRKRRK